METPIDTIRRLIPLSQEMEAELRSIMVEREFRRGERIEGRAELQNNIYFISSGLAREFIYRNGTEQTVAFFADNEFIVLRHTNMVPDSIAHTNLEFLERSKVFLLPRQEVVSQIGQQSDGGKILSVEVMTFILAGMVRHVFDLEERNLMLQSFSARQRYSWMASRYPPILERATTAQVASFLGVTKETLYRIRSNKYPTQ